MKKKLLSILAFLVVTFSICRAQNPILWGITSYGGINGGVLNGGTIFNYNVAKDTETLLHSFGGSGDGNLPLYGSLMLAKNGLLYGMTAIGGANGDGVIFSYNIGTGTEIKEYDFGSGTDGSLPDASLMQAKDDLLYGTTYAGGTLDSGTIFSYNTSTGKETVVYSFGSGTDGKNPYYDLIQAGNSLLYGTTIRGGTNDSGTLFSYNITTGVETDLHDFGTNKDGTHPGGAVFQASDSLLYGMTYFGGTHNLGTIFSYNIKTSQETILHNFGKGTDGSNPGTSNFIQLNDSMLYGLTLAGGLYYEGTLFSFNILLDSETVLYNFVGGFGSSSPSGSLLKASNGLLYATAGGGGLYSNGAIFSYNISTATEADIYDFKTGTDGEIPSGNLIEVDDTPAVSSVNLLSTVNTDFLIYPNPTSGQFIIKTNNNQNGYTLDIYNLLGEKIYQSILTDSQNTIDLDSEPAGMYFIYLKSNEATLVGKVFITK